MPESAFGDIGELSFPSNVDPCAGYPTPKPLPNAGAPPTVFFLHIPKCAGSTITLMLRRFADITHGVGCAYMQDGESIPAHKFSADGRALNEAHFLPLGSHSLPYRMAAAMRKSDPIAKMQLLAQGGCRTLRGHCTISRLKHVQAPVFLFTVLRDPIERFISMYDFGKKTQMKTSAWSRWFQADSLNNELLNKSSVLHLPFIEKGTQWIHKYGQWISFFFYGTLHQLSGLYPAFTGAGMIDDFAVLNAEHMADAAIANLCKMHLIAFQDDTVHAINSFIDATDVWANYSHATKSQLRALWDNPTPNATSRNPNVILSDRALALLRKRLYHEYRVFRFAKQLVRFRTAK